MVCVLATACGGAEKKAETADASALAAKDVEPKAVEEPPKPPPFCPEGTKEFTRRAYRWCATSDGSYHGPFQVRTPSGAIELEGRFEGGKMAGEWTGYWPDGTRRWTAPVSEGLENGDVEGWYPSGRPHYKIGFARGKHHGAVAYWYDDGQQSSQGAYEDGKPIGQWTFWHSNGQKAHELTYKKDGSTNIHQHWDMSGKKTSSPAGRMQGKLIQPVVNTLEDRVVECYQHSRMMSEAEGKIVTQFTIDYSGDVTRIAIFESDFKHPFMHTCLRRQVESLRFPSNPWGPQPIIRSWSLGVQ
jgi:antitoxin component YwqK of YwqJK toxin-antitoxin module